MTFSRLVEIVRQLIHDYVAIITLAPLTPGLWGPESVADQLNWIVQLTAQISALVS